MATCHEINTILRKVQCLSLPSSMAHARRMGQRHLDRHSATLAARFQTITPSITHSRMHSRTTRQTRRWGQHALLIDLLSCLQTIILDYHDDHELRRAKHEHRHLWKQVMQTLTQFTLCQVCPIPHTWRLVLHWRNLVWTAQLHKDLFLLDKKLSPRVLYNNNNNNKIFIYPDKKPISQSRDWLVLTGDQH